MYMYPIILKKFSAIQSWDCPESFGESGLWSLRLRVLLRGSDNSTLGCGIVVSIVWNWTKSPMASGANSFGCCTGVFCLIRWRLTSASSRLSAISCHSFCSHSVGGGLELADQRVLLLGSSRFVGLVCSCDSLGRGQLVSLSSFPVMGLKFPRRMRLAVLTPTSALRVVSGLELLDLPFLFLFLSPFRLIRVQRMWRNMLALPCGWCLILCWRDWQFRTSPSICR